MKKKYNVGAIIFACILGIIIAISYSYIQYKTKSIRIGILHSQTGPMAFIEVPAINTALLAIKEINNRGGVLGKLLEPVLADGKSDPLIFAQEAERLITQEKVAVIFGCVTSASRKAVLPVIEKHNHFLIYPMHYEGLEESKNVLYIGITPSQNILPGITWCFYNKGKKFYLVGTEDMYSRPVNEIAKYHIHALGGTVVGESYVSLDSSDVAHIVKDIITQKPDVILNTITGKSNFYFFKELRSNASINSIASLSVNIADYEFGRMKSVRFINDYVISTYFSSLINMQFDIFIESFSDQYGPFTSTNIPAQNEYAALYMWKDAVKKSNTIDPHIIRGKILAQTALTPLEALAFDKTRNTWQIMFLGKINFDGSVTILWNSKKVMQPFPYPPYGTSLMWNTFVQNIYDHG